MNDYGVNFRARKVDLHDFSMIPRADIPRSKFKMQSQHKTTISASNLIPVYVTEVMPGDTFSVGMTAFCRMSTPIYPLMDNLDIESWFFYVPNRIIWSHWVNLMGEQPVGPADSISYSIPQIALNPGPAAFSLYDYMGIPTAPQISGTNLTVNALPFRAYNEIWTQWFRDENLQNSLGTGATNTRGDFGDGPDPSTNYTIQVVAKRHDYFTSCLPWTQKGATPVTLPLGTSATVKMNSSALLAGAQNQVIWLMSGAGGTPASDAATFGSISGGAGLFSSGSALATAGTGVYPSNLYADLSTATAATINQIRMAFQTQRLLERDARGGTRYQETVMAHFGVRPLDMRVQRPEYLGGGKTPVTIAPVPQTTATGLTGGTSPLGTLAAAGTAVARGHGFHASFTEHGYVIGLVAVRGDCTYQQGLRRMWTRLTRYDFYYPVFANLGEQAVRQDEIYCIGTTATDQAAFGYQEHWGEYRYQPSIITGAFRSTYATPLDAWHCAQKFASAPALNAAFIQEPSSAVLIRNLAAGASANNEQFLCDFFFDTTAARPMPMYSVPGLVDHF